MTLIQEAIASPRQFMCGLRGLGETQLLLEGLYIPLQPKLRVLPSITTIILYLLLCNSQITTFTPNFMFVYN